MKTISKSGDSDRLTILSILAKLTLIQVFKSIQIAYSLKNTTRMVLKYHMQGDEATGSQNEKIQPGRESKLAADAKNS